MRIQRAGWACLWLALLGLAGCGDGRMSQVTGMVKLDGKPLEKGQITFYPADGQAQVTGGPLQEGRYSVRVPVGTMKVVISAPKVVGEKAIYPGQKDSPKMPITNEALPARYNDQSELRLEVKSGTNEKDFELQSDKQK